MNSCNCRRCDLGMIWLSFLLTFSGIGLFYFNKTTNVIREELFVVWFIASILLTELTLFDSLHNQRLRKKVFFAFLLHFIPILSIVGYWWWKIREPTGTGSTSKQK